MTLESRLERLEAEREILRTLYDYGHALDYGLRAAWMDCWNLDAVLRWPKKPPMKGRDALHAAYEAHTHAPDFRHKHLLCEPRIAVEGDVATVESMFVRLDDEGDGPYLRSFGRYLDRLSRCADNRWRFDERIAEMESGSPARPTLA